jgi:16S rRNA U516 pseudouridylate synthase RsuA-like enzyme
VSNICDKKRVAEYYRKLYNLGVCSREIAKEMIQPYLIEVNLKSRELAEKYNQKHRNITFANYVR